MSGSFIDSNVFIYLFDSTDPTKQRTAQRLVRAAIDGGTGSISFQVVQETLHVLTRKLQPPLSPEHARRFLDAVLVPLWRITPTPELYRSALDIQGRYGYGFYDALIISAALAGGSTRLYSEDLRHGQRIEGLRIENPFVPA